MRPMVRSHCRAHCSACSQHFAATNAFDRHRRGGDAHGRRHCISPRDDDALGRDGLSVFEPLTAGGSCLMYADNPQHGVTVWCLRPLSGPLCGAVRPRDAVLDPGIDLALAEGLESARRVWGPQTAPKRPQRSHSAAQGLSDGSA
jgi:hypothetical protein